MESDDPEPEHGPLADAVRSLADAGAAFERAIQLGDASSLPSHGAPVNRFTLSATASSAKIETIPARKADLGLAGDLRR